MLITAKINGKIVFCNTGNLSEVSLVSRHFHSSTPDIMIASLTLDPADTTKILISAFVLSRLDYCNALLSSVPQYLMDRLQSVKNAAARLTVKASESDHIIPILHSLHWLPVAAIIQYKVSSLCYSSLSDSGPEYLYRILRIYTPSRQLRLSSDDRIVCVPSIKTKTFG